MDETETCVRVLQLHRRCSLFEWRDTTNYGGVVRRLGEYAERERWKTLNFLDLLELDYCGVKNALKGAEELLLLNIDLYGEGIEPKKATKVMNYLRAECSEHNMRQLMLAGVKANLDYGSREGFGFFSNHPLGNWCEFFEIEENGIEGRSSPIRRTLEP